MPKFIFGSARRRPSIRRKPIVVGRPRPSSLSGRALKLRLERHGLKGAMPVARRFGDLKGDMRFAEASGEREKDGSDGLPLVAAPRCDSVLKLSSRPIELEGRSAAGRCDRPLPRRPGAMDSRIVGSAWVTHVQGRLPVARDHSLSLCAALLIPSHCPPLYPHSARAAPAQWPPAPRSGCCRAGRP